MTVFDTIFKAYDVRGKVGEELTPEVSNAIGRAFANWLSKPGVIAVGRDMRPDSESLATALIDGLRAQGRDVWDIGLVTTDMIYFAVGHYGLAGGAVVTASHNPGEYNGIKMCADEARAIGEDTGLFEIRDAAAAGIFTPAETEGTLTSKDMTEEWITHALSFIDPSKLTPLRLVVDAGNGMAGSIFPELEPYVPWEITELYFELDGSFPNHEANPMKFETLNDMTEIIKKEGLDGGIAFDGDGDRAFLVDETGEVLTGGVMSAMMSEYFLRLFPGSAIIYDARNSHSVTAVIAESGGQAIRSKVGHSNIKALMREHDAPFGGEATGHFYFRDNWYADSGLIAAVIGLYVATLSGEKLSVLRKKYTRFASLPEANFIVHDKAAVLASLKSAFASNDQDTLDGLTVTLNTTNWFNVRASNTEPVLRLNAEAANATELAQLVSKVTAFITA